LEEGGEGATPSSRSGSRFLRAFLAPERGRSGGLQATLQHLPLFRQPAEGRPAPPPAPAAAAVPPPSPSPAAPSSRGCSRVQGKSVTRIFTRCGAHRSGRAAPACCRTARRSCSWSWCRHVGCALTAGHDVMGVLNAVGPPPHEGGHRACDDGSRPYWLAWGDWSAPGGAWPPS